MIRPELPCFAHRRCAVASAVTAPRRRSPGKLEEKQRGRGGRPGRRFLRHAGENAPRAEKPRRIVHHIRSTWCLFGLAGLARRIAGVALGLFPFPASP